MATRRQSTARQQPAPRATRDAAASTAAIMTTRDAVSSIVDDDEGVSIVKPDTAALESITKSEVAMQLDAAHRWPRDVKRFLQEAEALATVDKETAESCIYKLARFDRGTGENKPIVGPSIRLAEMCASSWTNLHTGARILDIGDREVTAQALAWDLEKNLRVGIEVQRGIVTSGKRGSPPQRFGDDMIRVTCMAAISIALRNAIFRVIPRALVNHIYAAAVRKAVGATDAEFEENRKKMIGWFLHKKGVPLERIAARLGIGSVDEMKPEHLEVLIGIANAIKNNEQSAEEAFPAPKAAPTPVKKSEALDAMVNAATQAKPKSDPPAANDTDLLTAEAVLRELNVADAEWEKADPNQTLTIIRGWSPAEQRIAYDWAIANNDPSVQDTDVPERPAFTVLERKREPGEEG